MIQVLLALDVYLLDSRVNTVLQHNELRELY